MNKEKQIFIGLVGIFLIAYFLPIGNVKIQEAFIDAFRMLQWYAIYHTLPCVVPAMFIAGAIAAFLSKEAILKHLGPKANPVEAYGVASIGGLCLAVCSCSVLPMFAGIYRLGAGLGPAATFLVAGPVINVMAVFLTARVLGIELGVARTITAIGMSIIVGLLMAFIFRKSEEKRIAVTMQLPDPPQSKRKLWQTASFLAVMIAFLVFSDWVNPGTKIFTLAPGAELTHLDNRTGKQVLTVSAPLVVDVSITQQTSGEISFQIQKTLEGFDNLPPDEQKFFEAGSRFLIVTKNISNIADNVPKNYDFAAAVFQYRWYLCLVCAVLLAVMIARWFERDELTEWMDQTWWFSKAIIPLLFGGVFVTGFATSLLPADIVAQWVGGNRIQSNAVAAVIGSLWYFATLTEIPLMQALLNLGMGKGPALTLLLAGPTISLPSIIVICKFFGMKKGLTFILLVVVFSAVCGMTFGYCY
ncbi:MAG: permease [Planctomycetaceae bacterium]|nr:permease [Planctomycetaceae bacterium]